MKTLWLESIGLPRLSSKCVARNQSFPRKMRFASTVVEDLSGSSTGDPRGAMSTWGRSAASIGITHGACSLRDSTQQQT